MYTYTYTRPLSKAAKCVEQDRKRRGGKGDYVLEHITKLWWWILSHVRLAYLPYVVDDDN